MTQLMGNPLFRSFLRGEIRVAMLSVLVAFVVMTVLFIFPVFVSENENFHDLNEMTIVSKVVLPLQLLLVVVTVGTAANALLHVMRAARSS